MRNNPGRKGRPVTIRGVEYPSCAAAARALDLDEKTVRLARIAGKLDGLGSRRRVSIEIDGEIYDSRAAAARALGVPYHTLRGLEK